MARAQGARKPSGRRALLPGFQAISTVSRKKGLEATTLILRPPGEAASSWEKTGSHRLYLPCHSSRQLREGGSSLISGWGRVGSPQHRRGERGQLRLRAGRAPGPCLVLFPRSAAQIAPWAGATERRWQKQSEDAGLPGGGLASHLLPARTFLQAPSRAAFPFPHTLYLQQ